MPALLAVVFALISMVWQIVQRVVNIYIQPLVNELQDATRFVPLPPADLADMVERNIVGEGWAASEAGKSGLSEADFALMVKDTGEPYGIEQALDLLRRGLISEDRFTEVLYYSRVRNEFLPDVLQLAHATMTPGDAIELALKQIVPHDAAQDLFSKGGGLVDQFDELVAAAGNPIGPEKAVQLWMHGDITEAELQTIIAHSRINPMFYDVAKLTEHKWLQVFQIELALKAGTVKPEDAAGWLAQDGYQPDQIAAFVTAAASGKTAAHKALSEAQITELYVTGVFTHDQADAELQAVGYDPGEVQYILDVYLQRRLLSISQAGVTRIGKAYMAARIDHGTASNLLDQLGIDPAARDHYLQLWDIEAQTELRELTMAQVGSLYKKGLLTDADALQRWQTMGYSTDDAALLLANYGGNPPSSSPAAAVPPPTPPSAAGTGG